MFRRKSISLENGHLITDALPLPRHGSKREQYFLLIRMLAHHLEAGQGCLRIKTSQRLIHKFKYPVKVLEDLALILARK